MNLTLKKKSVLPGFGLTLGYTVLYLSLVVLLPLGALVIKSTTLGWSGFWQAAWNPGVRRFEQAHVQHVAGCRDDQCCLWTDGRVDARSLHDPGKEIH